MAGLFLFFIMLIAFATLANGYVVSLNKIKVMITKKMYFMDCHLAGRKYHDADEVWDELKVGNVLRLEH